MNSVILRGAARILVPLQLAGALGLLVRGHNDPGGGFIAGLVAAGAFTLLALAEGVAAAQRWLRVAPGTLTGVGLLLALGSGLPALVLGRPYLSGLWSGEWAGGVRLGTPLIFDAGVFLVVLGVGVSIVFALMEE